MFSDCVETLVVLDFCIAVLYICCFSGFNTVSSVQNIKHWTVVSVLDAA